MWASRPTGGYAARRVVAPYGGYAARRVVAPYAGIGAFGASGHFARGALQAAAVDVRQRAGEVGRRNLKDALHAGVV